MAVSNALGGIVRPMARVSSLIVAAAFILVGCHKNKPIPETSTDAEPLRWLDQADVIADFTEHVEHQHDTRFVSQFAFSAAGAVGLDDTPEVQQLVKKYGERHLPGTTDIITSAEQRRLLWKASNYVKRYNILLLHYLRNHPNI